MSYFKIFLNVGRFWIMPSKTQNFWVQRAAVPVASRIALKMTLRLMDSTGRPRIFFSPPFNCCWIRLHTLSTYIANIKAIWWIEKPPECSLARIAWSDVFFHVKSSNDVLDDKFRGRKKPLAVHGGRSGRWQTLNFQIALFARGVVRREFQRLGAEIWPVLEFSCWIITGSCVTKQWLNFLKTTRGSTRNLFLKES